MAFRQQHGTQELSALLHRRNIVDRAEQQIRKLFRDVLAKARKSGDVRDDLTLDELASYCMQALTASGQVRSEAAARRLVAITIAGLRPPAPG